MSRIYPFVTTFNFVQGLMLQYYTQQVLESITLHTDQNGKERKTFTYLIHGIHQYILQ